MPEFDERMRAARQDGAQVLSDSLSLQRASAERSEKPRAKGPGRRRKGAVIDLDNRTLVTPKRRRWLTVVLVIESIIAVIAVGVLVAYLVVAGDTIR